MWFGFALFLLGATGARACSIARDIPFLSNPEMAQVASDIVLARCVRPGPKQKSDRVYFTVVRRLKNQFLGAQITTYGTTDPKYYRGRSDETDFSRARPGTYAGSCSASDFQLGKVYLLFLSKQNIARGHPMEPGQKAGDEAWAAGLQILSRDREEVDETGSAWVKAVEHYVRIGALKNYDERKAALETLRQNAARDDDAKEYPSALVADIARHFQMASSFKSYDDLKVMLASAIKTRDNAKDDFEKHWAENEEHRAVNAMAGARHRQAFETIRQYTARFGLRREYLSYFGAVKGAGRLPILLQAVREARNEDERRDVLEVLTSVATAADGAAMREVLGLVSADTYSGELVARWFARHPSAENTRLLKAKVAGRYEKNLRLSPFLAMLGDENIVAWAAARVWTKDYQLPIYIIGYSPTARAEAMAREIVRRGGPRRLNILEAAYSDAHSTHPRRWARLREMVALPQWTPESNAALAHQLAENPAPEDKALLQQITTAKKRSALSQQ